MQKLVSIFASAAILLFIAVSDTAAQNRPAVPKDHEEFLSSGSIRPDETSMTPGPRSPLRTASRIAPRIVSNTGANTGGPVVGTNVRVNDPQQPFPNGLLGRSETTIAASKNGMSLLVGFNDAQGFCGPPFGAACTPENPPGLSGFAFSTDGGVTWTDGGAPDPARFGNVFTRGDPWMDRGGSDQDNFFYANLSVDAATGDALGVSVHRGHFNNGVFAFEDVRTFNAPNPNDFYDKEAIAADTSG